MMIQRLILQSSSFSLLPCIPPHARRPELCHTQTPGDPPAASRHPRRGSKTSLPEGAAAQAGSPRGEWFRPGGAQEEEEGVQHPSPRCPFVPVSGHGPRAPLPERECALHPPPASVPRGHQFHRLAR